MKTQNRIQQGSVEVVFTNRPEHLGGQGICMQTPCRLQLRLGAAVVL